MIRQTVGWVVVFGVAFLVSALGCGLSDDRSFGGAIWAVIALIASIALFGASLWLGVELIQGKGW